MTCKAVFTVEVAPPSGAYVQIGFEPSSFEIERSGRTIRIIPEVKVETYEYGDPEAPDAEREDRLRTLRVEVDHDAHEVPPPAKLRRSLRAEAATILRPLLIHLKMATQNPHVDVGLATLNFVSYLDDSGVEHHPYPGMDWLQGFTFPDFWHEEINEEVWKRVKEATSAGEAPTLEDEWAMDALSFHSQREYDLSLVAAAISLETSLKRLLISKFVQVANMTAKEAGSAIREMNMPMLLRWLRAFELISPADLQLIEKITRIRNDLVHGQLRRAATRQESTDAIKAARGLSATLSAQISPSHANR